MFGQSGVALTKAVFRKQRDSSMSLHGFLVAVAVSATKGIMGKKLVNTLNCPYGGLKVAL